MHQLPAELLSSLQNVQGFDEAGFKAIHESGEKITSVRINPTKIIHVKDHFPDAEKVPWCSTGYYLSARPSFTLDPLFHAGAYYVQEAGSMFLEEVLRQTANLSKSLRVLDLCASPGGKSTLIQSVISPDSLLVSNEVIKSRVGPLTENITKWGAINTIVTNNDAKDFQRLPSFFDLVVADAPCSGSGLFRKDNDAITEWSKNNVELCSQRQQRILADVLPALKAGGTLIYSTCSYSEKENEEIADLLSENHSMQSVRISINDFTGIVETQSKKNHCYGYRFYPDKIKSEGFFIAAFRKPGEEDLQQTKKYRGTEMSKRESEMILPYLDADKELGFLKQNENVLVLPKELLNNLWDIQQSMYIKKAGVNIGTLIRDELIPSHALAMSGIVSGIFPGVELTLPAALDYLRKKEISISAKINGWALIKYNSNNLGFIKILPGRINNYYPKELRILNR